MGEPKINILYVYYEPFPSGQSTHVASIIMHLDRSKFTPFLVLPNNFEKYIEKYNFHGLKIIPLPMKKIFWPLASMKKFVTTIKKYDIKIVHVHSQEASFVARILAKLAGVKKIVYTPQTIDVRNKKIFGLYKLFEFLLSKITTKMISVNERDRERLIQWGIPANKIKTIYNGIDLTHNMGHERTQNFKKESSVILQIGRLSPQKDPVKFIEGAKIILEAYPRAKFLMVGNGSLQNEVEEKISELELRDKVSVIGYQENVTELLKSADIITLTSAWEGTPYSIIEAMAWGKPVVVTDVNGCAEIVENEKTGFISQYADVADWSQKVIFLLKNPDLAAEYGKAGRLKAEMNFSINKMMSSIEQVYLDMFI
ncbi:MAG: glycosyltransferase family 4 protein [Anaerolineaceae bacterium]